MLREYQVLLPHHQAQKPRNRPPQLPIVWVTSGWAAQQSVMLRMKMGLTTSTPSHHPSLGGPPAVSLSQSSWGCFSPSWAARWAQAAIAIAVTWFAVGSISAHFTHFTGSSVETFQASALSTALDAILALPVPRAPLAWLPWAHLTHVSVVARAADGPLWNQEQARVSHLVQHRGDSKSNSTPGSYSTPLTMRQTSFLATHEETRCLQAGWSEKEPCIKVCVVTWAMLFI